MIDIETVINLHDAIILQTGGLKGTINRSSLESALGRIDNYLFYGNIEEMDIFDIASQCAFAVSKSHSFSDGNKRTALALMLSILLENNIELGENLPLDDIMVDVASDKINSQELANYLRENAIFIE